MLVRPKWPEPETLAEKNEEDDPEEVFIVGALIQEMHYDPDQKDVMVIAAASNSEVLDASGQTRVDWYRFMVPFENDVVQQFFKHEKPKELGRYMNRDFMASLVIEGEMWGTDRNPDDLSRPINVLQKVVLKHLMDVMSEVGEVKMADTDGMQKMRTKIPLESQLNHGFIHPEGAEAVVVAETIEDGSELLIEVQAKGWQECFEVKATDIEPWVDA